ncbi:PP2C family serine/threonine-protein phosphatase [Laspinema olomoucense]|uniref:Protein phosphatase 2C domain-containing protein n=1 Tax=Laspinema olomoucense D3b TaxID=2953688 RepID=A0ABT2NA73_9CYAN|nr:PP2C family serine/threonine-protein phosphatase [Laspinema sp. D3b]MCT7979599.1 protein phosphatase 2C domain-containing protein [Laspinema sp. D3b]
MTWKAIAESAIGTSHQRQQIVCQDAGDYVVVGNILIGAVADGAGSATYSDIGSKLAVKSVISYLTAWVKWRKNQFKFKSLNFPLSEQEAEKIFIKTLSKVLSELNEETKKGYALKDLACTLLVVIATPQWIAAMQIGDGFIVIRAEESDTYQLLFQPEEKEYPNVSTFVTSNDVYNKMRFRIISGQQKFISVSTDGLERLAIDMKDLSNCMASNNFFKPFEEGITTRSQQEETESLQHWLNSPEVNAKTDDDKTLLVCLFESGPSAGPIFHNKNFYIDFYIQIFIASVTAGFIWNFQYHYSQWVLGNFASAIFIWTFIILLSIYYNWKFFEVINSTNISGKYTNNKFHILLQLMTCVLGAFIGALILYFMWIGFLHPHFSIK